MSRTDSRRRTRRDTSGRLGVHQLPWRALRNPYPPIQPLSADQVAAIHEAALTILEEIGIVFMLPEALALLEAAGVEVDHATQKVRLDRAWVGQHMAHAPSRFTLHARNPAHHLEMGGNAIAFASVASAPNVSDTERGRRPGNYADFQDLVRLAQKLDIVHLFGGYPVEPVDLPPDTRHLDCLASFVTLADKAFHAYSLGRLRILDGIEIARIARGLDRQRLLAEPSLFTIINSSSPLRIDAPMLEGVIEMARANQVVVLTPFTLAGAMAPATLAGALAQQHAEALAGLSFTQMVNPGAPVMYGGFTSNVDMKSGAPAFGTPEYIRAALAGGQLARHLGLPYRSSNANAANAVDTQAGYESVWALWGAIMGGANFVMHGAGWMEGGLTASFEKMIVPDAVNMPPTPWQTEIFAPGIWAGAMPRI